MIEFELSEICRTIVEELGSVDADDEVLVVTDAENVTVARAITSASRATGATTSMIVRPRSSEHSNEPPDGVTAALAAVDVAITASTHSITHTDAVRNAKENGTDIVVLRGVTPDLMIEGGINTDYEKLRADTDAVRDMLDAASSVRVTSDEGTDVSFEINDHPAISLSGYPDERSGLAGGPPGEAPIAPDEGTANGTIVIDYSMDNIGLLSDPIELTVRDGFVTDVSGGAEATQLRQIIDEADENAGNLAEFAIGTNPDSRLVGNLAEDKKKRGTTHFAIGDNATLYGTRSSDIHLDGVVLSPTIEIDGIEILSDGGELDMDTIRSMAE